MTATLPTINSSYSPSPTPKEPQPQKCFQYKIHGGDFRNVALSAAQNLIFLLRVAKWKIEHTKSGKKFSATEEMPHSARIPESEILPTLTSILQSTLPATLHERGAQILTALVNATTIRETTRTLDALAAFHSEAITALDGEKFSPLAPPPSAPKEELRGIDIGPRKISRPNSYFTFNIERHPERLVVSWPLEFGEDYVKAATTVAGTLRAEGRDPSFVDFIAFHIGYHLLHTGHPITSPARGLGTVGFRKDTQTYLSLGDSGDGHIYGTTRKNRWMRGVVVHVEQERSQKPMEGIESYQPASIHDFARTRLHTGASAPNTYHIGRAMRDCRTGEFGFDFIKVVNTTSSAATAAFRLGAAECVVAMEGLTTSQMVAYMRGLGGHVLKGYKQVLSASFNLDQPILDDLNIAPGEQPKVLSEKMDIARRAIELTVLGGFDKITWGAGGFGSCVHALGFTNALELVHKAHEVGLITHMSAGPGFKPHNIRDAVWAGVDGVGVGAGIAQAVSRNGQRATFSENQIDKLTVARDDAAHSIRGRGVHLLARLDQMSYEGSITPSELSLRSQLYTALLRKDEESVQRIICDEPAAWHVAALEDDGEMPWVGRAKRILRSEYPLLRVGSFGKVVDGEVLWDRFVRCLESLVRAGDDEGIYAYYDSDEWRAFRGAYREMCGLSEISQGDMRLTLKVAPYS